MIEEMSGKITDNAMTAAIQIRQSESVGETDIVTPQDSVTIQEKTVIGVDSDVILDSDNNTVKSANETEKSQENIEQETNVRSDDIEGEESYPMSNNITKLGKDVEPEGTTYADSVVDLDQQPVETQLNVKEDKVPASQVIEAASPAGPSHDTLDCDVTNMALAYASFILKDCGVPKTVENFRNSFCSSKCRQRLKKL